MHACPRYAIDVKASVVNQRVLMAGVKFSVFYHRVQVQETYGKKHWRKLSLNRSIKFITEDC